MNVRRVIARAWTGVAEPPGHLTASERAQAERLARLADNPAEWAAASMELGALVCTKREPDCPSCPLRRRGAGRKAGAPVTASPPPRRRKYEGSDRQARGKLLAALRDADEPLTRRSLLAEVSDADQGRRALDSLILDGLVFAGGDELRLPD